MSFKMTYKDITSMDFQRAMAKIEAAPVNSLTAYKIRKISSELKKARQQISQDYVEQIIEKYAKRDADGKYNPNDFVPDENKMADFQQAQDDFGNKLITINRPPLTFFELKDVKLSANEQEAMGPCFDDSNAEEYEMYEAKNALKK